ncbi:hypothetical protein SAMN05192574_102260 [Mucilaginibacter gossypiicola]|uniref:Uncharacterized protein n=1 Tax=Mucilaginibacter gossypiicola TaxID=551995 RepID=A0A1H8DBA8_9SPHI|nr:hypothetical protein SAMN05192574_102260 [Mucilaginibacter gossypiicola]
MDLTLHRELISVDASLVFQYISSIWLHVNANINNYIFKPPNTKEYTLPSGEYFRGIKTFTSV